MAPSDRAVEGCRHDRAPLKRLGKIVHDRTGQCVYVLLCTECGFAVTTDELRRQRASRLVARRGGAVRRPPAWVLGAHFLPQC